MDEKAVLATTLIAGCILAVAWVVQVILFFIVCNQRDRLQEALDSWEESRSEEVNR